MNILVYLGFGLVMLLISIYLFYSLDSLIVKHVDSNKFSFCGHKKFDLFEIDNCTGWAEHLGRYLKSGKYEVSLKNDLYKGSVVVTILDTEDRVLLKLDREMLKGNLEISDGEKCYLLWEFEEASGKCRLSW